MTVAELIEKLKEMPQGATVAVRSEIPETEGFWDVVEVSHHPGRIDMETESPAGSVLISDYSGRRFF